MRSKNERNILAVLEQAGYSNNKKIADTLQGSIWSCFARKRHQTVIIKVTSRKLHAQSMIIHDGKKYNVEENIIKEKEILKYLTNDNLRHNHQKHKNIVGYYDFFKSNANYYFVMEHGGHMLFDFVVRVHRYIASNKLSISEWHSFVKIIFKQILGAVEYIHDKNVCHYDISLENLLISDVEVILDANGKIKFCQENIQIKLCDFGLSEQFISDNFCSTKYAGKANYKSPECTRKQAFDAKKNDVWTAGVCLWMMLIGGNMVNKASFADSSFVHVINGNIDKLLRKWNRIQFVDEEIIDLFNKIFQYENRRISVQQITQHSWLKN